MARCLYPSPLSPLLSLALVLVYNSLPSFVDPLIFFSPLYRFFCHSPPSFALFFALRDNIFVIASARRNVGPRARTIPENTGAFIKAGELKDIAYIKQLPLRENGERPKIKHKRKHSFQNIIPASSLKLSRERRRNKNINDLILIAIRYANRYWILLIFLTRKILRIYKCVT